jgi:hypothetical protein
MSITRAPSSASRGKELVMIVAQPTGRGDLLAETSDTGLDTIESIRQDRHRRAAPPAALVITGGGQDATR